MLTRRHGDTVHIDNFLLSRRVFSRGIEQTALSAVLRHARAHGARAVRASYRATAKNTKIKDFYPRNGFVPVADGGTTRTYEREATTGTYEREATPRPVQDRPLRHRARQVHPRPHAVGATADRPAVRDGRVVVAPVLPLSLAFDRRVIDGAEAADVFAEIKEGLESFKGDARETGLMGRDVPQER